MTKQTNHNHDPVPDHDAHANDNAASAPEPKAPPVVPTPARGAVVSLAALAAGLNSVDTGAVVGRSKIPLLQFKRDGNGTYSFGQKKTVPEPGARWAANPTSLARGYVCFDATNKVIGEKLLPVSEPMPDPAELPDKGFAWQEQWSVELKCLDGVDAGVEVVFRTTTVGGIQAVCDLLNQIRDRLNSGQHDNKPSPIVLFEKDSYLHRDHGRVWFPVFTIVDWMPMIGPAPAPVAPPPTSPPPPVEQPRRRRVG